MKLAPSYVEAHRYDGAAMQRGRRDQPVPCVIQPRDLGIVDDVRRHKFMTAPQLKELWWPGRSTQAADRRLLALFRAGFLDRFRPLAQRGTYPWTYHLAADGHRLLRRAGLVRSDDRFTPRAVYDYGHILHEIQLNAWVLAYRRHAGPERVRWEGEVDLRPPANHRASDGWKVDGLRAAARPVRPDSIIELDLGAMHRAFLVEYDRTRRVDKNFEKFRRYDAYLCEWWHTTEHFTTAPYVLFICQDAEQREAFIHAADRELTGFLRSTWSSEDEQFVGRQRMLFAVEHDAHSGALEAWQLPDVPHDHPERNEGIRRVRIGAPDAPS